MSRRPVLIDTTCRHLQRFFLLLAAVALAAPALAQGGALTLPRNLDQLTDRAAVIVRGNVVSARVQKHTELSGLNTVVVTLRVKETLKGQADSTFTFQQYLWDLQEIRNAGGYAKGQDVLLMMIAPSRYGLSSPAGMNQGRFRIERDQTGKEIAVNGHGNLKLFDGLSAQMDKEGIALSPRQASLLAKHRKGPVELRDLTALIREFAKGSE
ncbi:MAG: hypothetical protein ACRES3_09575 [Steroidobacteraceae bacterium]